MDQDWENRLRLRPLRRQEPALFEPSEARVKSAHKARFEWTAPSRRKMTALYTLSDVNQFILESLVVNGHQLFLCGPVPAPMLTHDSFINDGFLWKEVPPLQAGAKVVLVVRNISKSSATLGMYGMSCEADLADFHLRLVK